MNGVIPAGKTQMIERIVVEAERLRENSGASITISAEAARITLGGNMKDLHIVCQEMARRIKEKTQKKPHE